MKKVCLFQFPRMDNFHGYSLDCLDPIPYFLQSGSPSGRDKTLQKLYEAKSIDQMYRDRDPSYMRFLRDFVDKFKDADLVILANYNPVHPQVLYQEMSKPIKVLGFIDDPFSSYIRGIPYLWAFDGAFYISPSYTDQVLFKDTLKQWGCEHSFWFPFVPPMPESTGQGGFWPSTASRSEALRRGDAFFSERDIDLIYVGIGYTGKMNRLIQLRRKFGSRFRICGRWRLGGYGGLMRWMKGKPTLWTRVRAVSLQERTSLYHRAKIGFNMHLSDRPMETGNMRMYEVPAHGALLLCDKAGLNAHEQIFVPGKEAVFYDSIEDAIQKIEYYLEHDGERERIARAGFEKVHRDYDGELNLKRLLDWASGLPKKGAAFQTPREQLSRRGN